MRDTACDMTVGKPLPLLCKFALPLMVGNVCQQLYVTMDTLIVGRGVGVDALATLGAADWPTWAVLSVIIGLVQGFPCWWPSALAPRMKRGYIKP